MKPPKAGWGFVMVLLAWLLFIVVVPLDGHKGQLAVAGAALIGTIAVAMWDIIRRLDGPNSEGGV